MYAWEGGPALVQTVDFFTPIVDDPFLYGQIAAANALSDVYAMGGEPRTALAIAAFPKEGLETGVIRAIFRGGFEKLREAGTALLGGHTVQDPEIKFGYAVTGAIDPAQVLTNAGARAGDVLVLTKPLGTGIVGTAIKAARAPADLIDRAVATMTMLNKAAAETLRLVGGAHACTDVTGFGLLGHAAEMAEASQVSMELDGRAVPVLDGVFALLPRHRSGGMATNREHFGPRVQFSPAAGRPLQDVLFDPQTSGGLLVAVEAGRARALTDALVAAGVPAATVGRVVGQQPGFLISVV